MKHHFLTRPIPLLAKKSAETPLTMLSRFLPTDFNVEDKIAILAGRGSYPVIVAEKMRELGIRCCIIGFAGETSGSLLDTFDKKERRVIKVGQIGKMLRSLTRLEANHVLMAGQIAPRRLFKGLHPDLRALTLLAKLKEKNAETIFGAIAKEIEAIGVNMLDARSFLDDHLADKGMMTRSRKPIPPEYLEHGIRIAKEIARLDIGQGIVVRKGTVLIVEGFDGTDAMLRRAGEFETDGKIFVKTVKPAQDYRFDVPVFGLHTLKEMSRSKIETAALEAENTVVLDKKAVIQEANRLGIQIYGY